MTREPYELRARLAALDTFLDAAHAIAVGIADHAATAGTDPAFHGWRLETDHVDPVNVAAANEPTIFHNVRSGPPTSAGDLLRGWLERTIHEVRLPALTLAAQLAESRAGVAELLDQLRLLTSTQLWDDEENLPVTALHGRAGLWSYRDEPAPGNRGTRTLVRQMPQDAIVERVRPV